jgi:hypothetical protein
MFSTTIYANDRKRGLADACIIEASLAFFVVEKWSNIVMATPGTIPCHHVEKTNFFATFSEANFVRPMAVRALNVSHHAVLRRSLIIGHFDHEAFTPSFMIEPKRRGAKRRAVIIPDPQHKNNSAI